MSKSVIATSAISLAVAGILAAASAQADQTLYVSGASAQRNFWFSDLGGICSGTFGTAGVVTIFANAGANSPDIQAGQCTYHTTGRGTAVNTVAGIADGEVLTLQYAAEYGSVWGIAPAVATSNAAATGRRFLDLASAVGTAVTVSDYNGNEDTASAGLGDPHKPDLLVTDLEPSKWSSPDNWPYQDPTHTLWILGIGGTHTASTSTAVQPGKTQLNGLVGGTNFLRVNGQVLTIIVNASGPAAPVGNLSTNSVRALLQGKYSTWGQVPEVGGSNTTPVTIVRRDHGSGTEVATSLYFTGIEAGLPGSPIVRDTNNGAVVAIGSPVIKNSTNALADAVGADLGAIGFRSLGTRANTVTLNLDGIQPNAHNAAAGIYPFAYDSWAKNNTTASGATTAVKNIITALLADASSVNALGKETAGGLIGGTDGDPLQWSVTKPQKSVVPTLGGATTTVGQVAFGGNYTGGVPTVAAALTATATAPKALFRTTGTAANSETPKSNNNNP